MFECQSYGCQKKAGEGSERKEIFPNANKLSAKRELAMKLLHDIGTGHTGKMQFQPENGLPGPRHR